MSPFDFLNGDFFCVNDGSGSSPLTVISRNSISYRGDYNGQRGAPNLLGGNAQIKNINQLNYALINDFLS